MTYAATKARAMALIKRYGFVIDASVSGKIGDCYMLTIDHPTHSIGGDCRSIHICDYGSGADSPALCAWREAVERLEAEGPLLEPCDDPDCDFHHENDA